MKEMQVSLWIFALSHLWGAYSEGLVVQLALEKSLITLFIWYPPQDADTPQGVGFLEVRHKSASEDVIECHGGDLTIGWPRNEETAKVQHKAQRTRTR